jgi:hypothetical protein
MKVIQSGSFDGTPVSRCCTDKSTKSACCQPGDTYLYDYKDRSKLIGCCKPGTTPHYECCKDGNGNCTDPNNCGSATCKSTSSPSTPTEPSSPQTYCLNDITLKTGAVYNVCCEGAAPIQKAGGGGTNIDNMYECSGNCTGNCVATLVSP